MLFMMCLSAIKEVSQLIPSPEYIRCIENMTQLILLIGVLRINPASTPTYPEATKLLFSFSW